MTFLLTSKKSIALQKNGPGISFSLLGSYLFPEIEKEKANYFQ
jgi:hypothetical protein